MKKLYYHESFEYQDEYDYDKLGTTGIEVSAKRIVCPTCQGNGTHFRTDLDENAMVDSFNEDGDDDGFMAYRRGAFDQVCTECNGRNVVDDVDWDTTPKWMYKCIRRWEQYKIDDEMVRWAENGYR